MKTFLTIFAFGFIISCSSTRIINQTVNKDLDNKPIDYYATYTSQYDTNNKLIKETGIVPMIKGIFFDTIFSSTDYFYNQNNELIKTIRTTDEHVITRNFSYNSNNQLIYQDEIENGVDTIRKFFNQYYHENSFKCIKKTALKVDIGNLYELRYGENRDDKIPFDTTFTLTKESYNDSLLQKSYHYLCFQDTIQLLSMTQYYYNSDNNLIKTVSLNTIGDTISRRILKYKNDTLIRDETYNDNEIGKYNSFEIFDSNGHIKKLVNIDLDINESDTVYYKCDASGNPIEMKWKVKNNR